MTDRTDRTPLAVFEKIFSEIFILQCFWEFGSIWVWAKKVFDLRWWKVDILEAVAIQAYLFFWPENIEIGCEVTNLHSQVVV